MRSEVGRDSLHSQEWLCHRIRGTPTFFCKCVKRKGFKSFVLKVCETKGVADAFLRKCVNLKSLGGILAPFEVSRSFFRPLGGPSFVGPGLASYRATRGN